MFLNRPLDHINLTVPHLEEASEFYTKVLGFKKIAQFHNNGKNFLFLTDGNLTYELMENPEVPKGTLDHVAYTSTDLEKDYQYFKELDPTLLMGEIALAAGLFDHGMYYFFVKSPSGERVEFCQKKES